MCSTLPIMAMDGQAKKGAKIKIAVEKLLDELKRSHEWLQHLHLESTEGNISIILDALTTLKTAYAVISSLVNTPKEETKEPSGDNNA